MFGFLGERTARPWASGSPYVKWVRWVLRGVEACGMMWEEKHGGPPSEQLGKRGPPGPLATALPADLATERVMQVMED